MQNEEPWAKAQGIRLLIGKKFLLRRNGVSSETTPEKFPFKGLKVYFSGSIKEVQESDPHFAWKLVQYLKKGGAEILDEHVAARNSEEMEGSWAKENNLTLEEAKLIANSPEAERITRASDILNVYEATHMV